MRPSFRDMTLTHRLGAPLKVCLKPRTVHKYNIVRFGRPNTSVEII